MNKYLLFALPFLLRFLNVHAFQDSDGTYFVTSFPCYNEHNPGSMDVSLNFANNANQVNKITITYWSVATNSKQIQTIWLDPLAYKTINLNYMEVVKDNLDISKENTLMADPRIIITAVYSIKVISRIFNSVNAYGDSEMVPTSVIANTAYMVQLPKPNPGAVQLIHILGSDYKDVSVSVYHYINGLYHSNYGLKVSQLLGARQNVLSVASDGNKHAFSIYGDAPFFVVGAVTKVDLLSTNSIQSTVNSMTDYAYMHFYPSDLYDCTKALNGVGDRRMIDFQYTKSVYVTPPRMNGCANKLPINIVDQYTPNTPSLVSLREYVASNLVLKSGYRRGITSAYDYTPWIRFGGLRGIGTNDKEQLYSAFIHYIPETSQYITGDLTFVTFTSNSVLEIYAESSISKNSFYIDNLLITNDQFTSSFKMGLFNGKYNRFTIKVTNIGFHVLKVTSPGSYIAYVVGENVVGNSGIYGYVAGYNMNRLGYFKTTVETTTKSANPMSSFNYQLNFVDVVDDNIDITKEVIQIKDPRIYITSKYSMKVISRIYNKVTGVGDAEMLPSAAIAHNNYLLQLPQANPGQAQIIHILAAGTVNDLFVTVVHYIDGKQSADYILQQSRIAGQLQNAITIPADPRKHSISLISISDFFVVGAVTVVDLLATNPIVNGNKNSLGDYAYMHFYPSLFFDCTYTLNGLGDRRMISSQYTKSVYVAPPFFTCKHELPIYFVNQNKPNTPTTVQLINYVTAPLVLTAGDEIGTVSSDTYTPWIRFGGDRGKLPETREQLESAFMHYVPETSQWVNGITRFVTFTTFSTLEIYAEKAVTEASFYLDGTLVEGITMKTVVGLNFFEGSYNYYTIQVANDGFHTLNVKSTGSYIMYVIGDNVNGMGTYGYVAGYNKNRLPLIRKVETTTKGASNFSGSLFVILSVFIFVKLM
uniref:IgGFc_binding domain-containing protein n=1 Tax=Rhabditophanes sp. KR3021 TaxID=114890 RepID=A0AC35TWU7_9BILA